MTAAVPVVPRLEPHEYQEESIVRMMNEPTHSVLLASDTGTGKTLGASEFLSRMPFDRILVVGVKDTYAAWAERLAAQSYGLINLRRIDGTVPGKQAFADMVAGQPGAYFSGSQYLTTRDWAHEDVIRNDKPVYVKDKKTGLATDKIERRRKHLKTYAKMAKLDAIVYDEVHVVASRDSVGIKTLRTIKTDWKIGASATFYGNLFTGAFTIARWLWPELIGASFGLWKGQWCATDSVYVKGGDKKEVVGELNPGAFVSTLPCYIRWENEFQAPPARIVEVDLLPAQREDYDSLEQDLLVWLQSPSGVGALVADIPITLTSRLRTATLGVMSLDADGEVFFADDCASTKLRALKPELDRWGNQPVVIYCDSKKFVKIVVKRMQAMGYAAVEWSGDVSSKNRDQIKADFMRADGTTQYIVAVTSSFSTGLDGFQKVCNKIAWLTRGFDNRHNLQAVARVFRQGMTEANGGFDQFEIVARDTLDAGIFSRKVAETMALNKSLRKDSDKIAA